MALSIQRRKSLYFSSLIVTAIALLTVGILTAVYFKNQNTANAANKVDWLAGNIISDANFTNKDSMSVSDIQAFLDSKIGTCDIMGTGIATEYNSSLTRAQYAASRGWAGPPYTCLNKYYEVPKTTPSSGTPASNFSTPDTIPSGAQSAAWIIKDAANKYGISPKVLLVKIATESAGPLTSDKWPLYSQYKYAMGSHCPDSGAGGSANCDPNYAGFSIQIYSAAQLMRYYLDNMGESWWTYKKPYQNNTVLWNVTQTNCGSSSIYIENKATAALYTYTPYQPNEAALNNMYGTGDGCSAYGNRNFWRVYWDWFGSTRTDQDRQNLTSKATNTLNSGEQLKPGEFLTSANGKYILVMQPSGQLVLYKSKQAIWQSGSTDWSNQGSYLTLQSDGNLVVYNGSSSTWGSDTAGSTATRLVLQDDGNLVLYKTAGGAVWGSGTDQAVPALTYKGSSLTTGSQLNVGDFLRSPDWRYYLVMQSDGNLVMYTAGYTQAIWSSATDGKGATYIKMQTDGNLVMYGPNGAVWGSGTDGASQSATLNMQSDGNLVLYNTTSLPLWGSGTDGKGGKFVRMQDDGNLVIYTDTKALWGTSTDGKAGKSVTMQTDGNIVIYSDTKALWGSGTDGSPKASVPFTCTYSTKLMTNEQLNLNESLCSSNNLYKLMFQSDGNLVLYSRKTTPTWGTDTTGKFFKSNLNL